MFKLREKPSGDPAVPERARYTKYYEHDGQLRAYANRSMLMAGLFGVIALVSLSFAIYVRLHLGGDESRPTKLSGGTPWRSGANGH